MRSTDAGISRLGRGERVAVTTTASSCASARLGTMATSARTLLFTGRRLRENKTRMSRVLLLALLGFALPSAAEIDPSIVQELRKGGYVLYMRHASTDFSQNDAGMTSYEDCTTQRNLTDKGL